MPSPAAVVDGERERGRVRAAARAGNEYNTDGAETAGLANAMIARNGGAREQIDAGSRRAPLRFGEKIEPRHRGRGNQRFEKRLRTQ